MSFSACDPDRESNSEEDSGLEAAQAETDDGTPQTEDEIEIHTWWRSASESAALDAISQVFNQHYPDVAIRLTTITGQALESIAELDRRIVDGDVPDVFQTLPRDLNGWAHYSVDDDDTEGENILLPIDSLLASSGAADQIPEEVLALIQVDGTGYGVPLGLHRQNGMFLNKSLMADLGLVPPRSLSEFSAMCEAVAAHNEGLPEAEQIFAIANTLQSWAIEIAFKSIIAASAEAMRPNEGGSYLVDFFDGNRSVEDAEYVAAAEFLNTFFACSNQPPAVFSYVCQGGDNDGGYCTNADECGGGGTCVTAACRGGDEEGVPCTTDSECTGEGAVCSPNYHHEWDFGWNNAADLVRTERAVAFIHGDWAKGEYDAAGFADYEVVPAFGTDGIFIYNVDVLATFAGATHPINANNFMLTALSPEGQAAWSVQKGSTPARRDIRTDNFDDVARKTYDDYLEATFIQDTETLDGWNIGDAALTAYWRARSLDGFASEGAQFDTDLGVFLEASRVAYGAMQERIAEREP